ncbi:MULTISPECIES: hypothetical protein [unclassified Pseudomonas]|uniref:hypothetical protein n=1 Tax=unclassified Pseudomonas TaxID=196821 RepID=UPI00087197D4|nr:MULTISPECIES: hypothetical protein [unclassified Pseudomonas]SCW75348.1 hypothetical protein SAMN03159424_02904 [Pseudomonas sp. NFACC05-1]SFL34283.1 hypothetical protein SAMN03159307_02022 [Pseudomonas sp. NFACC46-3]
MTTVVWDTKILAADTCHRVARNTYGEDADKIFVSSKKVLFEGSELIAAAGSGNVSMLSDWWKYICESPCSADELKEKMRKQISGNLGTHAFLILTVDKCFKIEASSKKATSSDVTDIPAAIGSGGDSALPLLIQKFGVFTAIARAARMDRENTNAKITWISREPGSTTKYASFLQIAWARCQETWLRLSTSRYIWKR